MPQMMPQTCPRFTSFRFIHKQVRSKVVPLGLPLCALKVRMGPPGSGGQICLQLTPNYTVSWFSRNQRNKKSIFTNHLLPSRYSNISLLVMLFIFGNEHLSRPVSRDTFSTPTVIRIKYFIKCPTFPCSLSPPRKSQLQTRWARRQAN